MNIRFTSCAVILTGVCGMVWGCSLANAPSDIQATSSSGDVGVGGATSSSSSSTSTSTSSSSGKSSSSSSSSSSGNSSSSSSSTSSSSGAGGGPPCGPIACDPNAACVGNACVCNAGYTGDGTTCTDIDECAVPTSCDPNATCTNTPGSFTCTCNAGYTGDGKTCTDIDECTIAGTCDPNATCTNTPGSFTCTCLPGSTGDGITCTLTLQYTNGMGGLYGTVSADRKVNAQLACESKWGVGQCATDGCGSCNDRGYHKAGAPNCNGSTYWNYVDVDPYLSCGWVNPTEILIAPDNLNWNQSKYTNGMGGYYATVSSDRTVNAKLACESNWGVGACATDGCGSCNNRGYHKAGTPNCNGSTYWNFLDTNEAMSCGWVNPAEILISNDNKTWIQ